MPQTSFALNSFGGLLWYAVPSAPQFLPAMTPPPQPTLAPPTDIELALLKMQENQKQQQLMHLQQQQQSVQSQLTP